MSEHHAEDRVLQTYSTLKESGKDDFEFIFVSLHSSPVDFEDQCSGLDMPVVPFEQLRSTLSDMKTVFCVDGNRRRLSLVDCDGKLITNDGLALVSQYGESLYPFTKERIETIALEKQRALEECLHRIIGIEKIDAEARHIILVLGPAKLSPFVSNAARRLRALLGELEARHGPAAVRYLVWEDSARPAADAADAASGLPVVGTDRLLRGRLLDALCTQPDFSPAATPELVVLTRDRDSGAWTVTSTTEACHRMMLYGLGGFPWSDAAAAAIQEAEERRLQELRAAAASSLGHLRAGRGLQRGAGSSATFEDAGAVAARSDAVGLYFTSWYWLNTPNRARRGADVRHPEGGDAEASLARHTVTSCYEALRAAGRRFEVVYISADSSQAEFDQSMCAAPWLALPYEHRELAQDLRKLYQVNSGMIIVDASNGRIINYEGRMALECGADYWPFDDAAMERARTDELKLEQRRREEERAVETAEIALQEARPGPKAVLRRLRGPFGSMVLASGERRLGFGSFATVGAANCVVPPGGKGYYEVEIVECTAAGQVGWASDITEVWDKPTLLGIGEMEGSWAADSRSQGWMPGDVLGLAVSVPVEQDHDDPDGGFAIWLALNGDFDAFDGSTVGDSDLYGADRGVFPAVTGQPGFTVKYNFGEAPFKHAPPAPDFQPVLAFCK
mmetsp:Transcript_662/g.1503  ORF Transcript_662/g.1503 Transcript_662/m.1503 type:complete len:677 (-) Transcript_662:328-2358(-)